MKKLIITDRENIIAPAGMSFSVNGKPSEERDLSTLDEKDIQKLELNPKDKKVIAKLDKIKEEQEIKNAR